MKKQVSLVNSPVCFTENGHTYTLDGHTLQGVTPIIRWLFPETYKGIPRSVLEQAADYGTMIHKKCELYDSMGICDDETVQAYAELMEQRGLKVLLSEYLVSDGQDIASAIDKVTTDYDLCDIKTTSKVHIPNVTMQLSIYAWLFERQNPEVKAGELYCIWLPKPQYGKPDIIRLQRVSSDICQHIVEMYLAGAEPLGARAILAQTGFQMEPERKEGEVLAAFADLMDELINIKTAMEQMQEREKVIKEVILSQMQHQGYDKWGNDLIQFTRKPSYERTSVDSTALKKQYPDIYTSVLKTTRIKESLIYNVL